ncbi:MAG: hypothetical protein DU429_03710 [Candidatus Tokpelaia sp.]|nr:MAG: hypothetical protein DU430_01575 [Candidatus Tokpelaia sp.]KAA6207205.1 MAG: hypothetical protein DU429_03710 [Candidatus Tokpelaia sp.]
MLPAEKSRPLAAGPAVHWAEFVFILPCCLCKKGCRLVLSFYAGPGRGLQALPGCGLPVPV